MDVVLPVAVTVVNLVLLGLNWLILKKVMQPMLGDMENLAKDMRMMVDSIQRDIDRL